MQASWPAIRDEALVVRRGEVANSRLPPKSTGTEHRSPQRVSNVLQTREIGAAGFVTQPVPIRIGVDASKSRCECVQVFEVVFN